MSNYVEDKNISLVTSEDFQKAERQLNFEGFQTEGHKALSQLEFVEKYISKGFEVYTKPNLQSFCKDIESKISDLEKGGDDFNKGEIVKAGVGMIESLDRVVVRQENGELSELWVREKVEKAEGDDATKEDGGDKIEKGEETEDDDETEPADVAKSEDASLNKGEVSDALGHSGDKNFKKTGKEIKEKLTTVLATVKSKAEGHKTKMEVYRTKLGVAPTRDLDEWETRGIDDDDTTGLRVYDYDMTYFNDKGGSMGHASLPMNSEVGDESRTYAKSKEDASLAREHNTNLRKYLECIRDEHEVKVFQRNVEEGKSYELSLRQLGALGF